MRVAWIDIAKGVGILLVVLGHSGRGLSASIFSDGQQFLSIMDEAIYAFHMPLFFLLSGVTFGMRPPLSISPSLVKRAWAIFYPFVVWTYIFLTFKALAGSSSNSPIGWEDFLVWPLPPVAHFWFLWALLLITCFLGVLHRLCVPVVSEYMFWIGTITITFYASMTVDLPELLIPFIGVGFNFLVVFAIGGLIGASPLIHSVPKGSYAIIATVVFCCCLWGTLVFDFRAPWQLVGAFLSLLLILPIMVLSNRFAGSRWIRWLAYFGIMSLPIYVMHTLFSAGLRIMLIGVGVQDWRLHLIAGTAIGILGPLLAYLVLRRLRALRYVGLS